MGIEQLLNKLIKKGWRPFNKDIMEFFTLNEFTCGYRWEWTNHLGTIRDIVSKESWLWQFVCENHLYIYKMWENKNFIQDHFKNEYNECCYQYLWDKSCYEYYLLESALKDESELEDFLLNSIKLD